MARRRFIADEVSRDRAALTGEHADHLIRVLRVRAGQEFDIVAGSAVRRGRIASVADHRVEFDLAEEIHGPAVPPVTLLLAVFKFDRMEWAIEKATELGVTRIIPVIASRTDTHLSGACVKRVDRWRKIALQAAEQSRRSRPPQIDVPAKLREAAKLRSNEIRAAGIPAGSMVAATKIVLSESEEKTQLRDAFAEHKAESEVLLAVGPEGGWTDEELRLFEKENWRSVSLGPTILRAETAAIAALAITFSELTR